MKKLTSKLFLIIFFGTSCSSIDNHSNISATLSSNIESNNHLISETNVSSLDLNQVEILKQQVWENLVKVPGTNRDFSSVVKLRIADGNIIDADCKLIFPASSWDIASIIVDDYKDVLKKTSNRIYAVIYELIINPSILANEIYFNGLWRPWQGSHVHIEGRGIDIGYIKSSFGSGTVFNYDISKTEDTYAKTIRQILTDLHLINQYLSPWIICNPPPNCIKNYGVSALEQIHRDHLHLTLNPEDHQTH